MKNEMENDHKTSDTQLPEVLPNQRSRSNTMGSYLHLDADKILNAYGKYGTYQMIVYFLTNVVILLYAMNMMVMPFITEDPEFLCEIPKGNKTLYEPFDKCTMKDLNDWHIQCEAIPNSKYVYNTTIHESIASEFDLVCNDYESTEHASSIFLFGGMIASPVITQLSDMMGRKAMFLGALYLSVVCNLIAAWVPNYFLFLLLRFLAGFGTTGFVNTAFILCTESVSTSFRDLVPALPAIFWVVGYLMAGVFKLFIANWRWLYFAISIPGVLTIPLIWYTPESIHWLITNKKHAGVKKYITAANRVNRHQLSLSSCKLSDEEISLDEKPKRTMLDCFQHKGLFIQLCLNSWVYIVMSGTYWALSLFSTELSDEKMTGFFLSGFVELPAGILGTWLMVVFSRKAVSFWSLFLTGVSLLLATYLPGSKNFLMIFPLAGKCFNSIAWGVQPLILSELAPTTVRNAFSGVVSFLGDIGSVIAPYLKRLEAVHASAPNLLIAVTSFIAAFCILLMPETKDKKLPEDLDAFDPGPLGRFLEKREKEKTKKTKSNGKDIEAPMLEAIPEESSSQENTN